jgi:hypothetical protein
VITNRVPGGLRCQAFSISASGTACVSIPLLQRAPYLLKGVAQNVARWQAGGAQNCQRRTAQHGCGNRDGPRSALPNPNKGGLRFDSHKFWASDRGQKCLCRAAPQVIAHNLDPTLRFRQKCLQVHRRAEPGKLSSRRPDHGACLSCVDCARRQTMRAAPRSFAIFTASFPVTPVAQRMRTFSPRTNFAR